MLVRGDDDQQGGGGGDDPQTVRAAYLMMEPVAVYAIVPLAVTSLITGIVQALGTPWGCFVTTGW